MAQTIILVIAGVLITLVLIAASQKDETPSLPPTKIRKRNRNRKPRVRSFEEQQKRMNKKKYLQDHSEFITVEISELQKLIGLDDKDVLDIILKGLFDGVSFVKIRRTRYELLKLTKR